MKWLILILSALFAGSALAAGADPLTVADADRMAQEVNTIVSVSVGSLSFFLGWVAGAST
jgi:hypothetical protein